MEKHVFIDLGSDSEDDVSRAPQKEHRGGSTASEADRNAKELKPDVKNVSLLGKGSSSAVSADEVKLPEDKCAGKGDLGAGGGRASKRIKTEHGGASPLPLGPTEKVLNQGGAAKEHEANVPEGRAASEVGAQISPGLNAAVTGVNRTPKAEPGEKAESVLQRVVREMMMDTLRVRKSCLGSSPEKIVSTAGPEGNVGTHVSQFAWPKLAEYNGLLDAEEMPTGGGLSGELPGDDLEEGEIAEDGERSLEELEEEVRRHTELLRRRQEELEKQGGGPASVAGQTESAEGGTGKVNESRAIVRSILAGDDALAGPPRRGGGHRQFWHAGEYEVQQRLVPETTGSMAHVRVHPKFLHSNATSHKWALGAVAELLDNAVDEVQNGATHVSIDMERNMRPSFRGEPMLVVEDDGGGMDPDRLRKCMSLGYSAKTKMANTIGQYGNGFKTSTMRLGADVIVFTRCPAAGGQPASQSIGLLSFTFLKKTGHEDIVVPMVDFEAGSSEDVRPILRGSADDHEKNLATICEWSPFATQERLLDQFATIGSHGTRVVIFNLWENDDGLLELDFESDPRDIQIRGGSKDDDLEKATRFPNSRFYLTYMHSLRSYASILYLALPPGFRMFLRGQEIQHHRLTDDLRFAKEMMYRPHMDEARERYVSTTLGFWKDAPDLDAQGFNVYHKNRLIKPFWRVWNSSGSNGRGVVGVLEANFVEPAHDKQGFESTPLLQRLEKWLMRSQKSYWNENCQRVGYQPKRKSGSDPAYHAPSSAKSPGGNQPGMPAWGDADLDSPGLGGPGTAFPSQQDLGQGSPGAGEVFQERGPFPVGNDTPTMGDIASPRSRNMEAAFGESPVPIGAPNWPGKSGADGPERGGASGKQVRELSEAAKERRILELEQQLEKEGRRILELEQQLEKEGRKHLREESAEKDRRIADLEQRLRDMGEQLVEKEAQIGQLEQQLEGTKTFRLLNIAVAKLGNMKALLAEREATIKEQKGRLEVAEWLQAELSKERAEVARLLVAQEEAQNAAQREVESVREKGAEKISYLQGEVRKERQWNAERALQMVRMEEELNVVRGGNALAIELEAEKLARLREREKNKLVARDLLVLREEHRAAVEDSKAKGRRIGELERAVKTAFESGEKKGGGQELGQEPHDERGVSQGEKRALFEGHGDIGGSAKKARRASACSEVSEGGMKDAMVEEKSVSQQSGGAEEDEIRAEMRSLREEMAQMKKAMLSRERS